jgi:hypothetical protein
VAEHHLFFTLLGFLCSYRGIYSIFHSNQFPFNNPSNIHLQLIIPSNIHLQCLCSTKNEKKTTSRRQYGIKNYLYSVSLARPRNVKNKYVILRHLGDMCLFTSALRASVNKSHIPSLPQNNLYILLYYDIYNPLSSAEASVGYDYD